MKKLKGVESAEFNLATSQLKITGKGLKVNRKTIVQAVEKLGHKVEAEDKTKSAVLHIEGMDCEDEVSVIEKKVKSLKGLESFQVDLMSEALLVRYGPGLLSVQEIIKSIAETGMKARPEKEKVKGNAWWRDLRILSLFTCSIFRAIAFVLEKTGAALPSTILYAIAVAVGGYYPARLVLAALLVFIYSLGDVLEAYAVDRARGALRGLMELMPKEAVPWRVRIFLSISATFSSAFLLMSPQVVSGSIRKERSSEISFRENPNSWARLINRMRATEPWEYCR